MEQDVSGEARCTYAQGGEAAERIEEIAYAITLEHGNPSPRLASRWSMEFSRMRRMPTHLWSVIPSEPGIKYIVMHRPAWSRVFSVEFDEP